MGEKELRLALVCYGGVSLAVYMHGVTKEIWRLAGASRDFTDPLSSGVGDHAPSQLVYREILDAALAEAKIRLRVVPDIIAGASAGGINGVFLAQALETGQSLDPLTDLWLSAADADILIDPDARPLSRFTKFWARPLLWLLMRRHDDTVSRTVAPETRREVRRKLSSFIRARWFAPPFSGEGFTGLLLDACDAMAAQPNGRPLIPPGHPLDLFVTATDFSGHEERLILNSPPEIGETEHRLTIGFHARGDRPDRLASAAELVFAARATASFPGAFPPFTARELDKVLTRRGIAWPNRDSFLQRILPAHAATGTAEDAALVDGSVLANAPFGPAIDALRDRPARRVVDRRLVYIQPSPGLGRFRLTSPGPPDETGHPRLPGFFRTLFGAMSDIPREQPIRDNLEEISERSRRIRRMRHIVEAMRSDIDRTVETTVGHTPFLLRPTPKRIALWRARFQRKAARAAGFAYPAYAQLKLSGIVDEIGTLLVSLSMMPSSPAGVETLRATLHAVLQAAGIDRVGHGTRDGACDALIAFFRSHDVAFRVRRLRFLARQLIPLSGQPGGGETNGEEARNRLRDLLYRAIARYSATSQPAHYGDATRTALHESKGDPLETMETLAQSRHLRGLDDWLDEQLSTALLDLAASERRVLLRAYLGFPYYDIATLPLLQGEGLDEYDPIKIDRISPDDACAIRSGGAAATLRGIEFNSFGAFFSRAYRENDYLWGRLHGADRLIDILLSTIPDKVVTTAARRDAWKHRIFHAILDEEEARLPEVGALITTLRKEIDAAMPPDLTLRPA
jgi:patatin-related protein